MSNGRDSFNLSLPFLDCIQRFILLRLQWNNMFFNDFVIKTCNFAIYLAFCFKILMNDVINSLILSKYGG